MNYEDKITCLIPTSPIKSHPSTRIIQETIESIRCQLPTVPIGIMVDGIRPEQESSYGSRYSDYRANLDALCGNFSDLTVISADRGQHLHQIGMLRQVLPWVTRPLILFVEHDIKFLNAPIPWEGIVGALLDGDVNLVRFLLRYAIHPDHHRLIKGNIEPRGVQLTKTVQFSANTHIATRDLYVKILSRYSPKARCFLESQIDAICQREPWDEWKLSIFTPPEVSQQRLYHLDGRAGEHHFGETQVY